jgi:hypothetical protein
MNFYENVQQAQPVVCRFPKKDAKLCQNPNCEKYPDGWGCAYVQYRINNTACTSISKVPGQIKLRRVPGQNQKTQITKYSSILIDDFPGWRVIVHPKPLGVTVGIFCCDGPAQKLKRQKKIFLGVRVNFTFEITYQCGR